jgi:drug/metabolite transporter (DMT)-like permease
MRAALAMLASMAAFTLNDVCVKLASRSLPLGELITLRNTFATLFIVLGLVLLSGGTRAMIKAISPTTNDPRSLARIISWRLIGEMGATLFFLAALVRMRIADVTAILQFTPLAVTAGAALFLREPVGWRRWLAALVGLAGVFMIIRPGTAAFSPEALLAFAAVGFVVIRDLATRLVPTAAVSTGGLTLLSSVSVLISGLALAPFETWHWPDPTVIPLLMGAGAALVAAYTFIVIAMRDGDVAVVGPFRYTVIIWAIVAGILVWGEWPDLLALIGIAVITAAGVYTFHRERVRTTPYPADVSG